MAREQKKQSQDEFVGSIEKINIPYFPRSLGEKR